MAKKKKVEQEPEEKTFDFSAQLIGLLLILVGIIGFGFGPVGRKLKEFSMFLVGEWWACILILIIFLGAFTIIKKRFPKFFTPKLIGLYLLIIVVLTGSHYSIMKKADNGQIFSYTRTVYKDRIASMSPDASIFNSGDMNKNIGGGIIGAAFSSLLNKLFGNAGTIIVLVILAIVGLILLFSVDLGEAIINWKEKIFNKSDDDDEDEEEEDEDEDEDEDPHREPTITVAEDIKQSTMANEAKPLSTLSHSQFYQLPSLSLLDDPPKSKGINTEFTKNNKLILERVLGEYEIKGTVVEIHVGPAVTQYEVAVPGGTKLSKIEHLDKEIAMALAAKQVSIEAPIPGKSTVGIELPNPTISAVKFKEIMGFLPKDAEKAHVLAALGKDLMGRVQVMDITKTPHLLVAGATGSGKSVCMNSIIGTILMKYKPDEVKLVLVDPKKVEMSNYNGIPHLLWPVVTDPKKASAALQRVVGMMDERYDKFAETGVKKIEEYNEYVEKHKSSNPELEKMYYLVVIIDELADLMMVAAKEVEGSIQRITQLARAAGIHLIVATQRPSVNVITGVIKANIPSRIAFAVASFIDSKTILDTAGAEKLLGRGDMLYLPMGQNSPTRIQGCFITDEEIEKIINHVKSQQQPVYDETLDKVSSSGSSDGIGSGPGGDDDDPLYNEIYAYVTSQEKISASFIQRKYRLGYNRAARLIDTLEERGVIGPQNGSKPREVLIHNGEGEDE